MTTITEARVEQAAFDWLAELGWQVAHGVDITGDAPAALRDDVSLVVLDAPLRAAPARTCAVWFAACCESTATRPTNRKKRLGRRLSRLNCCRKGALILYNHAQTLSEDDVDFSMEVKE